MECSEELEKYFNNIRKDVEKYYDIANNAKKKGYDPEDFVDIPLAKNMAERVVGLISAVAPQIKDTKIVERIKELEKNYGVLDWRVALVIAEEVAIEKFCNFKDKIEAMEVGIRLGFAYITVGVVVSPLEGFVKLVLGKRRDGKEYFKLFYSGPVRSAGASASSVSLLIADYIRKKMGYAEYDPNEEEIKRFVREIEDYHERITNLQYMPSEEEIIFMVKNLPVEVDGDPSEKLEVSNYKNLPRIGTNRLRNGVCLVVAEGICQKASKIWTKIKPWAKEFNLENWEFLEDFIKVQKKERARGKVQEVGITPDYNYIKDLVAGRPILTHPLAKGGFRLRYGRTRVSGFSATGISPATQVILDGYIASGTQLKVERPGKSTVVMGCDYIEGPIVRLNNGSVVMVEDEEHARKINKDVDEIIFLGDILINYGDFYNRAHKLVPVGHCEEWFAAELKDAIKDKQTLDWVKEFLQDPLKNKITALQSIYLSNSYNVPLHPRYTYHWADITKKQFMLLMKWLDVAKINREIDAIEIKLPIITNLEEYELEDPKRVLELLGVPHKVKGNEVILEEEDAIAFSYSLGFFYKEINKEIKNKIINENENVLKSVNEISNTVIKDKSGTFIGARMGRPEKAKVRKLEGMPQVIFPVGDAGGKTRSFQNALRKGSIIGQFPIFFCGKCEKETIYPVCETCDKKTAKMYYCNLCGKNYAEDNCKNHGSLYPYKIKNIDINYYIDCAKKKFNEDLPSLIKGVRGTSNKDHVVENLLKGILRAKHNLPVNKDGTIRYDITEMTITHFKPREINVNVDKLRELGYEKDVYGTELENEDQLLELKPQDVILPACPEAEDEGADKILFRVAKFIDELLEKLYMEKRFYNLKNEQDLVGHLIIGLSPHTSAGIIGRIIGFSKLQGFLAHPIFHSIMRRDIDGDEACVVLLLDVLLNFSKNYLPAHRGVRQDAPLVLTSRLIPSEVDDMVFDMDVVWKYPLELYNKALEYKMPIEVKIERLGARLNTEKQYQDFGFTHPVTDINKGVIFSAYKSLPTMEEKVKGQMRLAEKLRAVDESDVARLIIERHFIRDIRGNLRKFSMQEFRCVNCNERFRRPPLAGICSKCKGKLIFTVAEGFVTKYLEPSIALAEKYELPSYLKQVLLLTKRRVESVFGKDADKQIGLGSWF